MNLYHFSLSLRLTILKGISMLFSRLMLLAFVITSFFIQNLFSQPEATAIKVETAPVMDGEVLNDNTWQAAVATSGFWQTMPNEGQPASEKTEVRIIYTENTIYFGVICYDSESQNITVSESRRDASLTQNGILHKDAAAPTCQTCHMQEGNHEVRTCLGIFSRTFTSSRRS